MPAASSLPLFFALLQQGIAHQGYELVHQPPFCSSDRHRTGTIPSLAFGKLTSLTDFRLDGNRLAGTIPPSLGDLGALTALGLSRNRLSGTIPFALKRLTHLSFLDVSLNDLEGCVPRVGPCKEGIDSDHDGHCYVIEHPGSAGERTHGNEMITGPCGGGGQRGAAAKPGYGREL